MKFRDVFKLFYDDYPNKGNLLWDQEITSAFFHALAIAVEEDLYQSSILGIDQFNS